MLHNSWTKVDPTESRQWKSSIEPEDVPVAAVNAEERGRGGVSVLVT